MNIAKSVSAALLAAALALSSCGCASELKSLTVSGAQLEDRAAGVTYLAAPFCFEPVAMGDEYAAYQLGESEGILYEIAGLAPTDWLTEEYTGVSFVFHNSEITLPTLAEFAPDAIHLCLQSTRIWEFATVTDPAEIAEIVSCWTEGEAARHPGGTPLETYRFKFSSPEYPGLYYALIYADYGDARYLYNRELTRCVEVGDMLRSYIDGIAEAETTGGETT